MIDRSIDRKGRLLMDQQWLERQEAVEIPPKDDPGAAENSEKRMFRAKFCKLLKLNRH